MASPRPHAYRYCPRIAPQVVAQFDFVVSKSEEELRRYQEPLTYRIAAGAGRLDALADGPSAFSLVEANRAYGVVSAAGAAA